VSHRLRGTRGTPTCIVCWLSGVRIDRMDAALVRPILELSRAGWSTRDIAERLGMSKSAVHRAIAAAGKPPRRPSPKLGEGDDDDDDLDAVTPEPVRVDGYAARAAAVAEIVGHCHVKRSGGDRSQSVLVNPQLTCDAWG